MTSDRLNRVPTLALITLSLALLMPAGLALADPCGMVPPIYTGDGPAITRVGAQKTYVFYRNGVETFVIRPGFSGKVEEFGMLIPFPSVPAMRKVDDLTFSHIAAAIDPPEVLVYLGPVWEDEMNMAEGATGGSERDLRSSRGDGVAVIKEEAIGMYEVVVLDAGSAAALKKWMEAHGYRYPTGMDKACEEYVAAGWCFVAVKTRVSRKAAVDPQPGMEQVNPGLGANGTFDGNVQAMGFRFKVDQLVVPMRLSSFNAGDLHNIVYLLSDKPMSIRNTPNGHVRRQVSGEELYRNITQPLPIRVIGGTQADLAQMDEQWRRNMDAQRNPAPFTQFARELFAFDLLASETGNLSHPHEEREKDLLAIGERLDLRGPEIDELNHHQLAALRAKAGESALELLKGMTLTVWDGEFDRAMLARENLTFVSYRMPDEQNTVANYNSILQAELADWQERFNNWQEVPLVPAGSYGEEGVLVRAPLITLHQPGDIPPPGATMSSTPPADQGPPPSAIPTMTLIWLAMGGSALGLAVLLLAFGLRPRAKH